MMCVWAPANFVDDCVVIFFFQAEDGIRDLVRSRGLGDVYKRQGMDEAPHNAVARDAFSGRRQPHPDASH